VAPAWVELGVVRARIEGIVIGTGVKVGAAVAGGIPARVREEISCEQCPEDERASPCERKLGSHLAGELTGDAAGARQQS
jgi:hypothetical protein